MRRLSWIIWVGPMHSKTPLRRKEGARKVREDVVTEQRSEREEFEDAVPLALKMKDAALSQGVWKRARKGKGSILPTVSRRNAALTTPWF